MGGISSTDQAFIDKLTGIVCMNLENEHFGVDELAREAKMSNPYIYQRLESILTKSTRQFIREVRLQKAMEMLQQEGDTASEVAFKTGFGSPAYFNTCFHEYFGYSPGKVNKLGKLTEEQGNENTVEEKVLTVQSQTDAKQRFKEISSRVVLIVIALGILIIAFNLSFIMYSKYFNNSDSNSLSELKEIKKSIAVLPFKSNSELYENKLFADELLDNIITSLSEIKGLKVISRTSAEQFRGKTGTSPAIAKSLGVTLILEGSVQRHNDRRLIMVRLIDAIKDQQIWAQKFDCELSVSSFNQSFIEKQIKDEIEAIMSSDKIK